MQRSHAYAQTESLSGLRIAGTSAAIAVHALVLMVLFTPTTWTPPIVDAPPEPTVRPVDFVLKTVVVPDPPPPTIIRPTSKPPAQVTKPIAQAEPEVLSDSGPPIVVANTDRIDTGNVQPPSLPAADISADVAPIPPYPVAAVRDGVTGMVLLRISVDAQGRPVAGSIEKSSGSRLLDQSALKFVLARWHFNPALQNGVPVNATALVPISFSLD